MQSSRRNDTAALAVLALVAMLAACQSGEALRLRARFRDAQQLRPGGEVQISGVGVGTVTEINEVAGSGEREFVLDLPKPAPPVPNDAKARMVRGKSGEYMIELDLGKTSGPPARNGDLLPTTTQPRSRNVR